MSHFAEIDENNIVIRITVGDNAMTDQQAYDWILNNLGGTWVQTSYNGTIRKNFAGIGCTYDPARDAFIAPKPYNSWVLHETTCIWEAPIPKPNQEQVWSWDESQQQWV